MKLAIFKYLALLSLITILMPSLTLAVNRKKASAIKTEKVQGAICNKLTTASTTIVGRMTTKEGKITKRQDTRLANLKTKRDERKTKLEEHRVYWDNIRTKKYAELMNKATTDEQKQAVTTFQNIVEAAVKTRREDIDAAITQFQKDVNNLVSARQTAVDQAVEKYKNSVQTALSQAQSDCAAGADPATVRTELKTSLETARTTLQTNRINIDKVSDGIETAITTRKAAVQAAWATFKTTLNEAKEKLKKSFSES